MATLGQGRFRLFTIILVIPRKSSFSNKSWPSPPASTAPEQLRINCWNTAAGFMSSLCQFLVHHFLIFVSVQGFWWIFLWHQRSSHFCHHDRTIWQQSKIGFCSGHLLSSDTRESLIFPALIWPRRLIYLYWLSWPLPLLYSLHYDVHPW